MSQTAAERLGAQNKEKREAAAHFIMVVKSGEVDSLEGAITRVINATAWAPALRGVRSPDASVAMREAFLPWWLEAGDFLRDAMRDDILLIDGLRALLPVHAGTESVFLYRGDSAHAWRRRRYGIAWTDSIDVARALAVDSQRHTSGGGVVLRTLAPPAAIICSPALMDIDFREGEYLIDRRKIPAPELVYGLCRPPKRLKRPESPGLSNDPRRLTGKPQIRRRSG